MVSWIQVQVRAIWLPGMAATALVVGTPVTIDSARWWHSPGIVEELQLSTQQVAAIDRIYYRMSSESVACARAATVSRRRLQQLLSGIATDSDVDAAASASAKADSACHSVRTLMLYRMFRELSSDQREAITQFARFRRPAGSIESRASTKPR